MKYSAIGNARDYRERGKEKTTANNYESHNGIDTCEKDLWYLYSFPY